jgi:fatty-acyl-CoA synthase
VEFTQLPKTSTGKIQKFKLREIAWKGREERIYGGYGPAPRRKT